MQEGQHKGRFFNVLPYGSSCLQVKTWGNQIKTKIFDLRLGPRGLAIGHSSDAAPDPPTPGSVDLFGVVDHSVGGISYSATISQVFAYPLPATQALRCSIRTFIFNFFIFWRFRTILCSEESPKFAYQENIGWNIVDWFAAIRRLVSSHKIRSISCGL